MAGRKKKDHTFNATHEEAQNGVYIDFEGFMDHPPSLIGILQHDLFEQIVLDENLADAAAAKGIRCMTLDEIIEELIADCQKQDCHIFAFTRAEYEKINEYTRFGSELWVLYKDSHKIAKSWTNKMPKESRPKDRSLKSFADFIGHPYPAYMGIQKATARLRAVGNMLTTRGEYRLCTPTVKSKWSKLLDYNRYDCVVTQELTLRATAE